MAKGWSQQVCSTRIRQVWFWDWFHVSAVTPTQHMAPRRLTMLSQRVWVRDNHRHLLACCSSTSSPCCAMPASCGLSRCADQGGGYTAGHLGSAGLQIQHLAPWQLKMSCQVCSESDNAGEADPNTCILPCAASGSLIAERAAPAGADRQENRTTPSRLFCACCNTSLEPARGHITLQSASSCTCLRDARLT